MSTRKGRAVYVADGIHRNIRDTIREHGGDPRYLEGYRAAGWESEEQAVDSHYEAGFSIWMEVAPKTTRQTYKLSGMYDEEWPTIRAEALGR